ncbi:aminotransferase class III-fold pyridoxal phosphate-dependent enzyme [Ornithinimicrobium pratense]|uniref:Aspartate aminotransferase family protein n=1 Tax=Ornithinimicrobium pratense TaxID=2593973 RepID=A0A5J6V6D2_9MICO|nr:aminotransferase class III-fold pyridoxal phosphate-dependent enzyme [Ornithinimicrobium pratense]QFG69449.1 aspartate aminotransferase family protein [Ornithinimicrobium pratense]
MRPASVHSGLESLAIDHPLHHPMTDRTLFRGAARTVVEGEGDVELDRAGRVSVIGTSGLWNVALGHRRHEVDDAVRGQLDQVAYATLFRGQSVPAVRLAQRLIELGPEGTGRALLCTGGAAGVETAVMLAHRVAANCGQRRDLVAVLSDGYHGTLIGSAALTGEDLDQALDGVSSDGVLRLPTPGDGRADDEATEVLLETAALLGGRIAAVVVEPVLGSAGVLDLPDSWCRTLRELADRHGFLVIADEVATGLGRTGHLWASTARGLRPDLLVTSKALTAGYLPLGAVLVSQDVARALDRGSAPFLHGETQGGNPLACAAALATLDVIVHEDLPARAARLGSAAADLIDERWPAALTRRTGAGLMIGLHLHGAPGAQRPSSDLVGAVIGRCADAGVIVHGSPRGISLFPPLTIDESLWERSVRTVLDVLERIPHPGRAHVRAVPSRPVTTSKEQSR